MYEKKLDNGVVEVHTTKEEFISLYRSNSAKFMSEYYKIPVATINLWIQKLNAQKRSKSC